MIHEVLAIHDYVFYGLLGSGGLFLLLFFIQAARRPEDSGTLRGCLPGILALAFGGSAWAWSSYMLPEESYAVTLIRTDDRGTQKYTEYPRNAVEYQFRSGKTLVIPRPEGIDQNRDISADIIINDHEEDIRIVKVTRLEAGTLESTLATLAPGETYILQGDDLFYDYNFSKPSMDVGETFTKLVWRNYHTNLRVVRDVDGGMDIDDQIKMPGDTFRFQNGQAITFDIPDDDDTLLVNDSQWTLRFWAINYSTVRLSNAGGDALIIELAPMTAGKYHGKSANYRWPASPPDSIQIQQYRNFETRYWMTWDKPKPPQPEGDN